MKWIEGRLPAMLAKKGDRVWTAAQGDWTYAVSFVADHASPLITASACDQRYKGPRLGSKELPIGSAGDDLNPIITNLGDHKSVVDAQRACEAHAKGKRN